MDVIVELVNAPGVTGASLVGLLRICSGRMVLLLRFCVRTAKPVPHIFFSRQDIVRNVSHYTTAINN